MNQAAFPVDRSREDARMKVLAIIPARSGSKGIRGKNIRMLKGKPLLAHSIEHALKSKYIDRVIVSTDSLAYAKIAQKFGAEVPFLRPSVLAGDLSTDLEVFKHALHWLAKHENYLPQLCVHLRPTCPMRKVRDIDNMIKLLMENNEIDSVRTVVPAPFTPFKMWFRDPKGLLIPAADRRAAGISLCEPCNSPRQLLPPAYLQNASIDVVRASVILSKNSMTGQKIFGYITNDLFDIDSEEDLRRARLYLRRHSKIK